MGAWGNGVWQDDFAVDVVYLFDQLLEAGATASEAVRRVILDPPWSWNDVDECDAQILALAALALQHEALTPSLRDWAVATITSGSALEGWDWEGADPKNIAARKEILERFKALLLRGTATAEELESVTGPQRV